jgi:hypothetical protein
MWKAFNSPQYLGCLIIHFYYPTVKKTLKADEWLTMIAEPQLASDLTHHPNSAI